MPYDPNRHHRRSIRLRGYDYRRPGAYFVTICAHGRQRLFGAIDGDTLRPNDAGRMVSRWWQELGAKFPAVIPDAFVVMPDHFHGIVMIVAPGDGANVDDVDAGDVVDAGDGANVDGVNVGDGANVGDDPNAGGYANPPLRDDIDANDVGGDANDVGGDANDVGGDANDVGGDANSDPNGISLSQIIQWFKIMTTTDYIRHVKQSGWAPFDRRVWQRGYWERIVRDDHELQAVRQYIAANPARWAARGDDLDALLARMEERI